MAHTQSVETAVQPTITNSNLEPYIIRSEVEAGFKNDWQKLVKNSSTHAYDPMTEKLSSRYIFTQALSYHTGRWSYKSS